MSPCKLNWLCIWLMFAGRQYVVCTDVATTIKYWQPNNIWGNFATVLARSNIFPLLLSKAGYDYITVSFYGVSCHFCN